MITRDTTLAIATRDLLQRIQALSWPLHPIPTDIATKTDRLPGIRAVLFDIYGTLLVSGVDRHTPLDKEPLCRAALAQVGLLGEQRHDVIRFSDRVDQAIQEALELRRQQSVETPEIDIVQVWRQVLSELPDGLLPDDAFTNASLARVVVEYECRIHPVWSMPGVLDMLARLKDQSLTLGIVSNAQFYTPLCLQALMGESLARLGFSPNLCIWSYQMGEAKPSTRLFQTALDRLAAEHDIMPTQTLFVGNDKLNDIWPARRLGCKTALFAGDARSLRLHGLDSRCIRIEPDRIVTHLKQLPKLLQA